MESRILIYSFIGALFFLVLMKSIYINKSLSTSNQEITNKDLEASADITMFMCGDVMLSRGIDQVLPHPGNPVIYEGYMKSAKGYVKIAEQMTGPIPYPVDFSYIWGDALDVLERESPDLRIINLETSITKSNDYWKNKGINYRMNPDNIDCLSAAEIDFCALANNHVLDWGYKGLTETVETLKNAGIKSAGVGSSLHEAEQPAIFEINGKGRVYLFSYGSSDSGIPQSWKATDKKPGVNLLQELSDKTVNSIKELINRTEQPEDVIVISIHWGGNWGYDISPEHVKFAHKLIDEAGVDVIHGHSSHHIKGIEVYNNKLIIYGCGDFINDYEGISGNESFRDDLSLMYFVSIETSVGNLVSLKMIPTQIRHFKVNRASKVDIEWVKEVLNREGSKFGTWVELNKDSTLSLRWK
jgi:poly-gamma-glutamate synthesis protein (capsule biosynthesis protein)